MGEVGVVRSSSSNRQIIVVIVSRITMDDIIFLTRELTFPRKYESSAFIIWFVVKSSI